MKKIILLALFLTQLIQSQNTATLVLPEVFRGLPNVRDFAMSNTQDEIYFTIESYQKEFSFIAFIKKENGKWTNPKATSFSGQFKDLEPFLAPNQLRLYFVSNRTKKGNTAKKDMDIWYVDRPNLTSEWSKPKPLPNTINTTKNEFYPSVNKNGDVFFTAEYEKSGKEDIFVSRFKNGTYTKPVALPKAINSSTYEFNAFVSPDESYIIFTSYGRKDDLGRGDMYISYKENNTWLPAIHLSAKINTRKLDYCPFVDNDGTLYFTSNKSSITNSLSKQLSYDKLLDYMNSAENGLSRIYRISLPKK